MEPTGIRLLDELLGGGFPRPAAVGIVGPVGSGKSTLVKQIAANALERDFHVQYYAIDESAEDVRDAIAAHGIDVEKYESQDKLSFVDLFALGIERLSESLPVNDPENIVNTSIKLSDLVAQGRNYSLRHLGKKQMGIMDSITPIFLMLEAKKVFQFEQVLKYATRFSKSIGIATVHTKVLDQNIENAMINFADVAIELERRKTSQRTSNGRTLRLLRNGRNPVSSRAYYYDFTPNGLELSPAAIL